MDFFFILFFFNALQFGFWKNLLQIFKSSKLYYEESSWFDTKICQKELLFIKKDKFFYNQKFQKQIQKLYKNQKKIFFFLLGFYFIFVNSYNLK